jgi:hypothetical protein
MHPIIGFGIGRLFAIAMEQDPIPVMEDHARLRYEHTVKDNPRESNPLRLTEAFLNLQFHKVTAALAPANPIDMKKQALQALQESLLKPADVVRALQTDMYEPVVC